MVLFPFRKWIPYTNCRRNNCHHAWTYFIWIIWCMHVIRAALLIFAILKPNFQRSTIKSQPRINVSINLPFGKKQTLLLAPTWKKNVWYCHWNSHKFLSILFHLLSVYVVCFCQCLCLCACFSFAFDTFRAMSLDCEWRIYKPNTGLMSIHVLYVYPLYWLFFNFLNQMNLICDRFSFIKLLKISRRTSNRTQFWKKEKKDWHAELKWKPFNSTSAQQHNKCTYEKATKTICAF